MPDVRNCKKCGKVFNYLGGAQICPVCKQKDEEDFKRVKEFLYEYPGANITQVSTELDISVEKIKRFLKEGRLEIVGENGNMLLECEKCGKSIKSGRFCGECERELSYDLKSTAGELKKEIDRTPSARRSIEMRYLNKEDGKQK